MNHPSRDSGTIQKEINDLNNLINGVPAEASDAIFLAPYKSRLASLKEELFLSKITEEEERQSIQIHIRLDTGSSAHVAGAALVGSILSTWQDLIDSLGQAVLDKATTRGVIPLEIRRQTSLDVEALAPGSFIIRLIPHQPAETQLAALHDSESLISQAFAELISLTESVSSPEQLGHSLKKVKGRVAQHYGRLLEIVKSSGMSIMTSLAEPGTQEISIAKITSTTAHYWSKHYKDAETLTRDIYEFTGRLTGANLRTGRFELDLGEEGVIAGAIEEGKEQLLHDTLIGSRYRAEVAEICVSNHTTESLATSYVLLHLESLS